MCCCSSVLQCCWRTLGLLEVQGGRKGTVTRGEMNGGSDCLEEEQLGTASFLVTHRQVEGGNRMLDVRGPLFHWRGETLRPLGILEAGTQGSQGQAMRSTRAPWSHPDSKSPLCFQPLPMTASLRHQTTWQTMRTWSRRAKILRSFISSFISFKMFLFLWSIDSSL